MDTYITLNFEPGVVTGVDGLDETRGGLNLSVQFPTFYFS
jgi:hypothetical protein